MIDKLKTIQYTLRDTEKYLVGVIKYDWMKSHPHFEYNQKQVLADIIKVLVNKQNELTKLIQELKGSEQ
jgi:hypothetical protein|tara:strand:+ start:356 stop:562 length:207 start_codon:yes stop_codon:yes gene_type:complete